MPAREQRGEGELDDVFLALHDASDREQKLGEACAGVARGRLQFAWPSATKIGCRCVSKWPCRLRLQPRRPFLIFRGIQFSPGSAAQRGRLAQWLERSPHTGEVQGSSPWSPTTHPTVQFYHQSLDDAKSGRDRCVQKVLGFRCRDRLWGGVTGPAGIAEGSRARFPWRPSR